MAVSREFESLDEEVKELLRNYKNKKATAYEPCTNENFRECLIGLGEQLGVLNINYIFNPYIDVEKDTLQPEALVKLINSVWTLLHYHKNNIEKMDRLIEHNHILEQTNKQLNHTVNRLKDMASTEKNETRACIVSAKRISDQSDVVCKNLANTQAKLLQITKQKETREKGLKIEITRLKIENEKLLDRLRNKSDSHTPCSEVCDTTLLQLRERDRKQRAVVAQLQKNNQELLRELVAMKEQLILEGLRDCKITKK